MKQILLLCPLLLLFLGSCTSSPILLNQKFESFQIQKINENGIQNIQISPSSESWPLVQYKESSAHTLVAKNIKFAVIGDTGCRLKESKGRQFYQNCHLSDEWPYVALAQTVAKEDYSFLVHTGDYHYREHCSDKKLCPILSQSIGYGWDAWWDDFFKPSQPLFQKGPILFVRGNHEDCSRAYSGWGPLSVNSKKFSDLCEEIEPYQWIEMQDLVMINFDDSAFEDKKTLSSVDVARWTKILTDLKQRISKVKATKEIWFLSHKPVLGYFPNEEDAEPQEINDNLRTLMKSTQLLSMLDYILSGHVHNQQIITTEANVTQIIVGHSGTALDPFGRRIQTSKLISTTENRKSFGYALFERTGFKKWNWIFKNKNGQQDLKCAVKINTVKCAE